MTNQRTWNAVFRQNPPNICEVVRAANVVALKRLLDHSPESVHFNRTPTAVTPLHVAAHDGLLEIAQLLLPFNPRVDAADRDNATPLFLAALTVQTAIVELSIQSGADPGHVADDGATPLHVAAINEHLETVRVLLMHGADRNHLDVTGARPLDMVFDSHSEVFRLLAADSS